MFEKIKKILFMKKAGSMEVDQRLLNIKELCKYLGIGETKARELVRGHNGFGIQIGNRWYADKDKLNRWIEKSTI